MLQYKFYCFYYSNTGGTGKTGLTVTAKVRDSFNNLVYSGSATEIGEGWYKYFYSTATDDFYTCTFSTTDTTVLYKDLPSLVGYPILYIDRKSSTLATPADIPSVTQIDAQLTSTHGAGAWGSGVSGAIEHDFVVTDGTTGLPISGVTVWVTTDEAGSNIIASKVTNVNGIAKFYLDAGFYYFRCSKTGYNFDPYYYEEVK